MSKHYGIKADTVKINTRSRRWSGRMRERISAAASAIVYKLKVWLGWRYR